MHHRSTGAKCSHYIFIIIQTYQSSLDKLFLACLSILLLATPGFEGRSLQGTAIREGQGPGPVQRALVHGVQVDGGLLLTLATREEGNTCTGKAESSSVLFADCVMKRFAHACTSLCMCVLPGTAGGTVRRRAVTVAMAISWLLYLCEQECPAVTMLGLRRVPSR